MWGVGVLQVFGICCPSEVVEDRSNYKNSTCGDLEIPLAVIRLRVTGLKKTGLVYLLDLFRGIGEEGWIDLVCFKPL